jgi:CO/xanthine dehydrogenase Mo-binding subunit
MRIILDNGAYSLSAPHILTCMVVSRPDSLYRYKNVKNQGYLVYTNKIPSNAFRGFGNPQVAFAVESQLDVIAEKLGIDPVELRLKNATQQGDITAHGWQIRSCGLNDCINNSARQIDWSAKKSEKRTRRGIGIACTCHPSGNRAGFDFAGSSALVRVDEDGRINVSSGEIDIGQGSQTIFAHIAAEVLGVPLKDVTVSQFDSDTSPYAIGTKASRVTHLGGKAVQVAAMDAKRQLLEIAGKKLEVKVDDLEIMNARVFVRSSPEKAMTIPETVKSGLYSRGGALIVGKGVYDPNTVMTDATGYGDMSSAYEFGAHTAEVEVDIDTGQIKVLNYVAAHDSGALNTTLAEGQVQGGVAQGIGYVLTEELVHKDGKIINDTFTDYKILTAPDVPPIESIFVESNDPNGPFGAKGLGEPVIIPVAPAIANAIYDAVGVRIKELPITSEKILKALREKEG